VSSKINNREDAQELVEDVFIKVSQFYPTFDESKSQLATWIYNIAKNVLIDYFRKKKMSTVSINVNDADDDSDFVEHVDIVDTTLDPLEALIQNEKIKNIKDNFKKLNTLEKKLMTMYAINGLTYNEIVDKLDIPLGTVKGTIHRARTILRESSLELANA
jgi:RNA polymerase sigma factor (sigma-70 family)